MESDSARYLSWEMFYEFYLNLHVFYIISSKLIDLFSFKHLLDMFQKIKKKKLPFIMFIYNEWQLFMYCL